jgi:hypothetical protein
MGRSETAAFRMEKIMFAIKLAGLLILLGIVLLLASALLGSALLGVSYLADWTIDAAQVFIWLAVSVFLGYFLAGCASEIRSMR